MLNMMVIHDGDLYDGHPYLHGGILQYTSQEHKLFFGREDNHPLFQCI